MLVAALACGSEPSAPIADSGVDPDGGTVGYEPVPPEAPQVPRLTPCPQGWREVVDADDASIATCDPWPETGREDCAIDEAHFPGGAGCEAIGTPCPAGDFAEDLPAGAVVYVRAGTGAGGDGSLAAPFGAIADALATAVPGAIVALSKGTFDEIVTISSPVTIWGACPAETLVGSTAPADAASIAIDVSDTVEIRNLRVEGARWGVDLLPDAGPVTIEGVVFSSNVGEAIVAEADTTLTLRRVAVLDTNAIDTGDFGSALQAEYRASVDVDGAVLDGNHAEAVILYDPGTHLVARNGVALFDDLASKRVAIGRDDSGSCLPARLLFKVSDVAVPIDTDEAQARRIDEMFFVAGYPVRLLSMRML